MYVDMGICINTEHLTCTSVWILHVRFCINAEQLTMHFSLDFAMI